MIQISANLYFGPNLYAARPVVTMEVQDTDLQEVPAKTLLKRAANRFPREKDWKHVHATLACLAASGSSTGWTTVLEALAIDLQRSRSAEPLTAWTEDVRARDAKRIVVETDNPEVAPFAANAAFIMTQLLFLAAPARDATENAIRTVRSLFSMVEKNRYDWNTTVIIEAAARRGIPFFKSLANAPFFTLGQGIKSKRIHSSKADTTGSIAAEIADDKHLTKQLIKNYGVPVPEHRLVTFPHELDKAAEAHHAFENAIEGFSDEMDRLLVRHDANSLR